MKRKIIVLILLIILIYKIVEISAAYKTVLQSKANGNVQSWVILVNDVNIACAESKTFEINEIIYDSENVAQGKIAPGAILKIPIKIDASQIKNIDIKYEIKINEIKEMYPNMEIKDVIEEDNKCQIVKTSENTYSGIIKTKETKQHNLLVSTIWKEQEINTIKDTQLGTDLKERKKVCVPILVNVYQYMGEDVL